MTIRLQEVVRSEVEGGLSGPANPIPSQSIDCGCGQLPCPRLAKYATRRLFVGLMAWIGLVQAAAYAYFYVAGPTIARRFQFDPYLMEWILLISELTPFLLGLLVAYWGDRVHRAAWIGGLVLLQSAAYFVLIIPHLTHRTRVIEEATNVTHMSLYADDSPELCITGSSRVFIEPDEPCFVTLGIIIAVQVMCGIANIAYYALGISYLDDNTKKRHVAAFLGVILAVKLMGMLLGFILAWGCLRLDAESLIPVRAYREQIGAWWLGFPIISILLVIPGLLLSWFPRMLPSEVVEQAAASLLHSSGRYNRPPRRTSSLKVGSSNFFPSIARLFTNKLFLCDSFATIICIMALVNFISYENLILESRFHVPRPTGMLLGFGDPMYSRLISSILKPVLIGLVIIISGLVIAKARPNARYVVGYNIIVTIVTSVIIFCLVFAYCQKAPIVGTDTKGSLFLLKYCNKNCGCSNDADFRPVCDASGKYTFYSPCHAGCTSSETTNDVIMYKRCSCVEEMTGLGNMAATDGPCSYANCQGGWLIFEFGTLVAYTLIATTFVGDLIITLRSVYPQDKAISIGFWLMWLALLVNIPGRMLYEMIASLTCIHWGNEKWVCHLHDDAKLGDYLCYLTGALLFLAALLKILVWLFSKNLKLYIQPGSDVKPGTEMQDVIRMPATNAGQETETTNSHTNNATTVAEVIHEAEPRSITTEDASDQREEDSRETRSSPLKYGPLGPGDRRTDPKSSDDERKRRSRIRNLDSEDELYTSSDEENKKNPSPKVAYRPLDIDSDVESDLSSTEPRSRRRILSRDYDQVYNSDQGSNSRRSPLKRDFPNPDDYGDPRENRFTRLKDQKNGFLDGSSKTNSFEFAKKEEPNKVQKKGDFNEVGIPIVDPTWRPPTIVDTRVSKDVKSLIDRYELNAEQDGDQSSVKSAEETKVRIDGKILSGVPLVAMASKRPSSRAQSSSGFSSSMEVLDKPNAARTGSPASNSSKASVKGSKVAICTDL